MDSVNNQADEYSTTSLKNPISRLAYTLAKTTLRFNLFVNEFIELYKFHMVLLAKKQNPTYSIVELSARTGLDRRYISQTLKNEELKKTNSKVRLVLQQMRQVCNRKNTNLIAKHGKKDSFESICKQVSSGSLTNNAVATELLRLGEIVDVGRKFEVDNPKGDLVHEEMKLSYASRRLLNEINIMCVETGTNFIQKQEIKNSIEFILESTDFGNFSSDGIINELVRLGNIKEIDETYELINWKFISKKSEYLLILLSKELIRMTNTIIENINNPNTGSRKLQRIIYSSQIHPNSYSIIQSELKEYFHKFKDNIYQLFIINEDDVPRGTYPTCGISVFGFGPGHNKDYSK